MEVLSFDSLRRVEQYLRTGKFPPKYSAENCYRVKRAAKNFIYKDGQLFRKHRGRLLQVLLNNEQVREVMQQLHNDNCHPGREQMISKIMTMYYWYGVTKAVKKWTMNCEACKSRLDRQTAEFVRSCLAYGCDGSSYLHPELSFHKFPKPREQRQQWLVVAQRDEGSVRRSSRLCSRHFEPDCFLQTEDGEKVLRSDAVPTIIGVSKQKPESQPTDPEEPLFHPSSLEDLLTCAATTAGLCPEGLSAGQSDPPHDEHQYSLRAPEAHPREAPAEIQESRILTSFSVYNHIVAYLTNRTIPTHDMKKRYSLKRKAQRFSLVDGILMYKPRMRSQLLKVVRSREEANSLLQQCHDNRGHLGFHDCFQFLLKQYYWPSMSKDLHSWISRCPTCLNSSAKWIRCSILNCTNYCGPVERKLGLTFHKFPLDSPSLLARWQKAAGRSPRWHPRLWSSVCSVHFTDDCFDRSGGQVELRPDAVPTVRTHGDEAIQSLNEGQAAAETELTEEQDEAFFAKFDAIELYISTKTYPPGLTFVEKNTFRRLCKKYSVKDEVLYITQRNRVVPVLRNRAQVNEALKEFHDEFNHLDVKKCLRLLNERCFWKNMRPDIKKWISKCSVCSSSKKNKTKQKQEKQQLLLPPPSTLRTLRTDPEVELADENDAFGEGSETESDTDTAEVMTEPEPQKKVHIQTIVQEQIPIQTEVTISAPAQTQDQMQVQSRPKRPTASKIPKQTAVHTNSRPQVRKQKRTRAQVKTPVQTKTKVQGPVQVQPEVQTSSEQVKLKILPEIPVQTQNQTSAQAPTQTTVQTQVYGPVPAMVQSKNQPKQTIPIFLAVRRPVNLQPGGPLLLSSLPNRVPINLPLNPAPVNVTPKPVSVNLPLNPAPVNLPPKLASVNPAPVNLPPKPVSVNLPLNPTPVNLPPKPVCVNLPLNPAPVNLPPKAVSVNLPLNPAPVNLPSKLVSVNLPLNPAPVNLPLKLASVNLPLNPAPVNLPSKLVSVNLPLNPAPVNLPPKPVSVTLAPKPAPVNLPPKLASVNLPLNPAPVNLPPKPVSVNLPLNPAPRNLLPKPARINLSQNPTTVNLQPEGPIILSSPPDPALVAGLWPEKPKLKSDNKEAPKQRGKNYKREQSYIPIESPNEMKTQQKEQVKTIPAKQKALRILKVKVSRLEETEASPSANNKSSIKQSVLGHLPTHSSRGRPLKRKAFPDEVGVPKTVCSPDPEPTVNLSSKRRKRHSLSEAPGSREGPLEARVVLQQCRRAKVMTQSGKEPQYAQIGRGLVVYVCFFDGATEDTAHRIADVVMNTQFFRDSRRPVSVLELPGGVLLLPQESLGWEQGPHRSMRNRGVIEAWRGSQLFPAWHPTAERCCCRGGAQGAPWSREYTDRSRKLT